MWREDKKKRNDQRQELGTEDPKTDSKATGEIVRMETELRSEMGGAETDSIEEAIKDMETIGKKTVSRGGAGGTPM